MSFSETIEQARAQYRAWAAVRRALANGTLVRPDSCEECGKTPKPNKRGRAAIEAHHYLGYGEGHGTDVIWLCSACHKAYNSLKDDGHFQHYMIWKR